MRILITGITGFVGTHLARELLTAGHEVSGLAPESQPPTLLAIHYHQADLRDTAQLERVVEQTHPEVVMHLGGLSHVGESWQRPGDYLRVNFVGTRNLLRVIRQRYGDTCRIVFASSGEVYGSVPEEDQPITEDQPLDPRSPYAMTKACAEQVAMDYEAIVVRSFNAVGPGQSQQFALPSFTNQLAAIARGEDEAVLRVGDLSPRRDFLHVIDAVSGYRTLIDHGSPGTVYNLASGEAVSIREAVERLMRISGVEATIEVEKARIRPVDVPLLSGDSQRLRKLGWSPQRRLDDALRDLWQHMAP